MTTIRNNNSQYKGQYQALIVERNGNYIIRAFDNPVVLLGDVTKSLSQGYTPIRAFEGVSWKALRDLEDAVIRANNGFEVDFNAVLNSK